MWKMSSVLICTMLASFACAQDSVPGSRCGIATDDAQLRHIADEWKRGYNRGDAARVAALYKEDATYLTQHFAGGIVHGRARIQAYVQRGVDAKYKVDTIEVLSTSCSGNMAYTIARYESTNAGQKAYGVNLLVLQKIKGKWLIVAHESAVPEASAIQKLD
jgi:uncharacterized protein (TIGR02246 family)